MRRILPNILLTVFLFHFFNTGQGQTLILKQEIHFNSGQFKIPASKQTELTALIDSFKNYQSVKIELQGHADNTGSYKANKFLSGKRANSVMKFLIKKGIEINNITVKAMGPDFPIASNKTITGRRLNRRVEILISGTKVTRIEITKPIPDISELFSQLETSFQTFCINRSRDTVIRCKQGTVIYIKANSLIPGSACGNNCVTIKVKEAFLKSDMLLDNLTTTSNGTLIESQGMLYTEAVDCNGKKLELQKGKDLVIIIPADSINPTAKIFDGNRTHDSIMNWTVNNNSILSDFTLPELDLCGYWMCSGVKEELDCKPCHFFFCRIGRIGKVVKGVFSNKQHVENILFRRCLRDLKRLKDTSANIISRDPLIVLTRPPLDSNLLPKCQRLEALFKKYGVDNMEALVLAINKPLLDSFKVSTIAQLKDTLGKIAIQKIELSFINKKISFTDYKYYVYNSSRFGWSNVDCFVDVPESKKTTLIVNVEPAKNIDCKLVFKNRRAVLPATKEGGKYEFEKVPKGEEAYIVAVKYEDGKPFLAMQQVIISGKSFDVAFKELTLEELKEQLRQLDQ